MNKWIPNKLQFNSRHLKSHKIHQNTTIYVNRFPYILANACDAAFCLACDAAFGLASDASLSHLWRHLMCLADMQCTGLSPLGTCCGVGAVPFEFTRTCSRDCAADLLCFFYIYIYYIYIDTDICLWYVLESWSSFHPIPARPHPHPNPCHDQRAAAGDGRPCHAPAPGLPGSAWPAW